MCDARNSLQMPRGWLRVLVAALFSSSCGLLGAGAAAPRPLGRLPSWWAAGRGDAAGEQVHAANDDADAEAEGDVEAEEEDEEEESTRQRAVEAIVDFYSERNPQKLEGLPRLLDKYRGREADLLVAIRKKYAAAGGGDGEGAAAAAAAARAEAPAGFTDYAAEEGIGYDASPPEYRVEDGAADAPRGDEDGEGEAEGGEAGPPSDDMVGHCLQQRGSRRRRAGARQRRADGRVLGILRRGLRSLHGGAGRGGGHLDGRGE